MMKEENRNTCNAFPVISFRLVANLHQAETWLLDIPCWILDIGLRALARFGSG
jgi:hypothetical protein